jgi:hypothetical protein
VVEFHGARSESAGTVSAWNIAELIEKILVPPPDPAPLRALGRRALELISNREASNVLPPRPNTVTVRADNVALLDFSLQNRTALEHRASGTQIEQLCAWIPVIEIHLVWLESTSAVSARDLPDVAKGFERRKLATTYAVDFLFPICRVIRLVEWPLIAPSGHGSV